MKYLVELKDEVDTAKSPAEAALMLEDRIKSQEETLYRVTDLAVGSAWYVNRHSNLTTTTTLIKQLTGYKYEPDT